MKIDLREIVRSARDGFSVNEKLAGLVALGSEMPWEVVPTKQVQASCSETGFRISEGVLKAESRTERAFIGLHETTHHGFSHVQRSRAIAQALANVSMHDCNVIADVLINEMISLLTGWSIPPYACRLGRHPLLKNEGFEVEMTETLEQNAERLSRMRKQAQQNEPEGEGDQPPDDPSDEDGEGQGSGAGDGAQQDGDEQSSQGADSNGDQDQQDGDGSGDGAEQDAESDVRSSKDDSVSDADIERMMNGARHDAKTEQEARKEQSDEQKAKRGWRSQGDGFCDDQESLREAYDHVMTGTLGEHAKVNWRSFLKGTLKGLGKGRASTYSRVSRRHRQGVVMAGRGDARPKSVLFCIDKSSSMAQEWCDESRSIIGDFLSTNAGVEVHVAEFNSSLREMYKASPRKMKERVEPCGSTNFGACRDAYDQLSTKPSKVFILTDCQGDVFTVDNEPWGKDVVWLYYEAKLGNSDYESLKGLQPQQKRKRVKAMLRGWSDITGIKAGTVVCI